MSASGPARSTPACSPTSCTIWRSSFPKRRCPEPTGRPVVVEHTFVTVLEPEQAMQTASAYLNQRGFVTTDPGGFRMPGDRWTSIKMRRGGFKAGPKTALLDLPQTLHMEWDRGR